MRPHRPRHCCCPPSSRRLLAAPKRSRARGSASWRRQNGAVREVDPLGSAKTKPRERQSLLGPRNRSRARGSASWRRQNGAVREAAPLFGAKTARQRLSAAPNGAARQTVPLGSAKTEQQALHQHYLQPARLVVARRLYHLVARLRFHTPLPGPPRHPDCSKR